MDGFSHMPDSAKGVFDELVAPHLPRLFRMAYRLTGNTPDAQDLVQDTCIIACENLGDITATEAPVAWLLRVLQNRFIDGDRRGRRAPFILMDSAAAQESVASPEPGPEDALQQQEAAHLLERAFQALEPMQRVLLGLRTEGHGLGEIESITGIPREVLRARLHRARRALAQRLDEMDSASSTATRARSSA